MSFIYERRSRHYFVFTLIFSAGLLLAGMALGWLHGQETKGAVLKREQAFVSALLEREIPAEAIAAVIKSETVTEEGISFLNRTGRTEKTNIWWLPVIQKSTAVFLWAAFAAALLGGGLLLFATVYFLEKREEVYQKAVFTVEQFAEGNFGRRLQKNETGTLYQLFAAVDQLATALQSKVQTEQKNKDFLKDIISDISHQLKTPVAALTMYVEIMGDEPERPELVKEFSAKAMQSLERMSQLIQALLKVMRIDAGTIIFDKRQVPVRELVEQAAGDLQTRAKAEGKHIIIEGNDGAAVSCDLAWTKEALSNLIKNALDHTELGGLISISWERTPLMLKLSVADNGSGIAGEDIPHIFKRFYRSKKSVDRQGVGLGLPLAKSVFEGQGGILSVSSAEGEGSVFEVTFPAEGIGK
ncbi:MAG: HAMP domain-containing histidine kinase [Clostridium sp.]|nr:HAMP domain-containing histidine kinase [Clostridium sp.]